MQERGGESFNKNNLTSTTVSKYVSKALLVSVDVSA